MKVDSDFLLHRARRTLKAGYNVPKWIIFCGILMRNGFTLELYEARKTVSKYITVKKQGFPPFKVRFSNHKPIANLEIAGSCDFFVGRTNLTVTTTDKALRAVAKHFSVTLDMNIKHENYSDFDDLTLS